MLGYLPMFASCLPGKEANAQHMILLRTVPAFKMWYNWGNCHKFCGFLAVRHVAVSYVGYSRLQKSCNKQAEQWKTTIDLLCLNREVGRER